MRPAQVLVLQSDHVEILRQNLRTGKTEFRTARRSQILLLRAEGLPPTDVAARLGCGRNTVWRVEKRYRAEELAALRDRARPGRPRRFPPSGQSTHSRTGLS
jgi:transposase